jgi:hypothetical protein
VRCRDATASCFVAKVWAEVFVHFHAVAAKRLSSMRNRLFGLPGRMSKKAMSTLMTLLLIFLAFSVSASLDFPSTAHAFFIERLFKYCQGLRHTFSRFAQNLMHQDRYTTPIKKYVKISTSILLRVILYPPNIC